MSDPVRRTQPPAGRHAPRPRRRSPRPRSRLRLPPVGGIVAGVAIASLLVALAVAAARPREPQAPVAVHVPTATVEPLDLAYLRSGFVEAAAELEAASDGDGIKVGTFLGGATRRFYGRGPVPERLDVIWKNRIGSGKTSGTASSKGPVVWSGTGWTGQPTLVRDRGKLYVIVGGFDHGLRKIDAATGETVWRYEFPDVIKGTSTVFVNPGAKGADDRILIVCGSRRGFGMSMSDPAVAPVRCVSFATGKELWRLPVPHSSSYSRDADGSPLFLDGVLYEGVESGHMYRIDVNATEAWSGSRKPRILSTALLYETGDTKTHHGNLVLEGSPAVLGDRLYVAAGSGHVYGLRRSDLAKEWDFKTGSDLDSTVVVTKSDRLLCGVEKQYIKGKGGMLMLDPSKPPASSVVWYFPTGDRDFADWAGGVIGSASVNDEYDPRGKRPALAAFSAIDGNLYLVSQDQLAPGTVKGFDGATDYPAPVLVAKRNIGGAISSPIMVDDHIVACGYDAKVHVFRIDYDAPGGVPLKARNGDTVKVALTEVATFKAGAIESTPVVWRGRIYIGSRDGFLYCLGQK